MSLEMDINTILKLSPVYLFLYDRTKPEATGIEVFQCTKYKKLERYIQSRYGLPEKMRYELISKEHIIDVDTDLLLLRKQNILYCFPKDIVNPEKDPKKTQGQLFLFFKSRKIDFKKEIWDQMSKNELTSLLAANKITSSDMSKLGERMALFLKSVYQSFSETVSNSFAMTHICQSLINFALLERTKKWEVEALQTGDIVDKTITYQASVLKTLEPNDLIYITYHHDSSTPEEKKTDTKEEFKMKMILNHFDFVRREEEKHRKLAKDDSKVQPKKLYFGIATNFTSWYVTKYIPQNPQTNPPTKDQSACIPTAKNFEISGLDLGDDEKAVQSKIRDAFALINSVIELHDKYTLKS